MLDSRFAPHNSHLEDASLFEALDPQLRRLKHQAYVYHSPLLNDFPQVPGVYTLAGGRQIGKSTLLKQWMLKLLKRKAIPESIVFISGELIDDHHALLLILTQILSTMPDNVLRYILIDEITYIKNWDKAVKYAADIGLLENTILMLTGSDLTLIQEARMTFPGRRGQASIVDFHLYPLSFKESVVLKHGDIQNPDDNLDLLFEAFNGYLLHGGYLTAINDLALNDSISNDTLTTYSEWIRGDMLKRGKQESFLREILLAIIKRYNCQISWNALAQDLSIEHPKTVMDYATILESMDALFIQSALLEDKLTAAPKKGKKLIFTDPFIFHAIRSWLRPEADSYKLQMLPALENPELCSELVEACVASHYRRFHPTYYIKAEGEVDIAYVDKDRFWPVEIKWTNQLRTKDLKQILKYPNGRIFAKTKMSTLIQGIPSEPLPLALYNIS